MTTASSSPFKFPFSALDSEAFSSLLPNSDTIGSFTRSAVEASTATTRASVKGMQEAGQTMMSNAKQQLDLSVETGKKMAEVASFEDAVSLQASFVKSSFENNLKGFNALSKLYVETMREAFAPITDKVKAAKASA